MRLTLCSLLLLATGCASVTLRRRDADSGTCTLSDGTSASYVPPRVAHSGPVPRATSQEAAAAARPGVYDCAILANGSLDTCRIVESNGDDDARAIFALGAWTFEAGRCGERPVDDRLLLKMKPQFVETCHSMKFPRATKPYVKAEDLRCKTGDGREGRLSLPNRLSGEVPRYPALGLEQGQSARVIVSCVIRTNGLLADCALVCSDAPAAEGNVLDALKTWRMTPSACAGEPVAIKYVIPVRFQPYP